MFNAIKEKVEPLRAFLLETKIGVAIVAEQEAKARAARQVIVDEITARRAEHARLTEAEAREIRPLAEADQATRAKADAARQKHLRAADAQRSARSFRQTDIARLENALAASADPRIDETIDALWPRYHAEKNTLFQVREYRTGKVDPMTNGPEIATTTNKIEIKALLDSMCAAKAALIALKLANPIDITAAIAAILEPVEQAWSAAQGQPQRPTTQLPPAA